MCVCVCVCACVYVCVRVRVRVFACVRVRVRVCVLLSIWQHAPPAVGPAVGLCVWGKGGGGSRSSSGACFRLGLQTKRSAYQRDLDGGTEHSDQPLLPRHGCVALSAEPLKAAAHPLHLQVSDLDYTFPDDFPDVAKDLVTKLLVVDPSKRLGGQPAVPSSDLALLDCVLQKAAEAPGCRLRRIISGPLATPSQGSGLANVPHSNTQRLNEAPGCRLAFGRHP